MNDNCIIIRLCDEDRARLDKIIEGLAAIGKRPDCSKCAKDVAELMEGTDRVKEERPMDEVDVRLKKLLDDHAAEAPKNTQEAPENSTPPFIPTKEETPKAEKPTPAVNVKTITAAELQPLAIALCRKGKQSDIKKVLAEYGLQTVSEVITKLPVDKHIEVYEKLKALEG